MKAIANPLARTLLGALSVACLALTMSSGARAEEVNAETLVDRLQIEESFCRRNGRLTRVGRTGDERDARRRPSLERHAAAQAEHGIEHGAGGSRQARSRFQRSGIRRRAAAAEDPRSVRLVFDRTCRAVLDRQDVAGPQGRSGRRSLPARLCAGRAS